MNVKIVNKYASLIANLDIDFLKSIEGEFTPEDIINEFSNFFFNKMIIDITAIKNYEDITTIQELSVNLDMSKVIFLLDDSEVVNSPRYKSQLVSMGIYNFTSNIDAIRFLIDNPNSYKDVAQFHQLNSFTNEEPKKENVQVPIINNNYNNEITQESISNPNNTRIIGIKNITEHAGSTTLTYLLKKQLERRYDVVAVEVDSNDFVYLNDHSLKHTTHIDLPNFIADNINKEVILVDLGGNSSSYNDSICTDIIYLIEPGLIKLNKLIRKDHHIFEELKDKKIVLNRSVLNETDVSDFEYESHSKIYFNVPYLDDKLDNNPILDDLLMKLGFARIDENNSVEGGKLFNIFK